MADQVAPRNAAEVAETLARASRDGRRVAIRGGGTKADWAPVDPDAGAAPGVVLSTSRLNAIVAHRPGDLTATIEAGAVLDDVNRALAREGQWLPLDPPRSDRATIGGIVATNDSGPRRQRYGAPRDLIIGVEIARPDGTIARAGGTVVKNVAGYDLSRLVAGSFGTLGVIVSATFKLYPIAPASRTVVVDLDDDRGAKPSGERAAGALARRRLATLLAALASSQLTPTAIELEGPSLRLLIRFESIEASTQHQSAAAADLARQAGATAAILDGAEEASAWTDHGRMWERSGAIARIAFMPAELADVLDRIAENAGAGGLEWELAGRAALGVLFLRLDGPAAAQTRAIAALRAGVAQGRGSVGLVRAGRALADSAGRWGPMGDAFALMQAVKRAFDPRGLLNAGAGPGGL
jgi:glycolate dehydrogenase FAD-binding subunit